MCRFLKPVHYYEILRAKWLTLSHKTKPGRCNGALPVIVDFMHVCIHKNTLNAAISGIDIPLSDSDTNTRVRIHTYYRCVFPVQCFEWLLQPCLESFKVDPVRWVPLSATHLNKYGLCHVSHRKFVSGNQHWKHANEQFSLHHIRTIYI
jgi:hypothetical protein